VLNFELELPKVPIRTKKRKHRRPRKNKKDKPEERTAAEQAFQGPNNYKRTQLFCNMYLLFYIKIKFKRKFCLVFCTLQLKEGVPS